MQQWKRINTMNTRDQAVNLKSDIIKKKCTMKVSLTLR